MAIWIEEFLYRGRPPTMADQPAAWHVVLGEETEGSFGKPHRSLSQPMTPEQAAEHGFDITKIIGEINADVMAQHTALKADHAALDEAHCQLKADYASLKAAFDARAELEALNAPAD